MRVPRGEKNTVVSNIPSLMKGWYERSLFSVGRVEIFVPLINSEPGDYPLTNLLLYSSTFSDEKYLILLLCI